ncbi:MAG: hypothetical protein AB7V16_05115 [Vulcanibacillus sp.]
MTTEWYIFIVSFSLFLIIGYYLSKIITAKELDKSKTNIIRLQNDGYDYILYKGKIKEMDSDYHHYLTSMDIIIYSKSIFIGLKEANKVFLQLSADAIQSVKHDTDKIVLSCLQDYSGSNTIIIRGLSGNQRDIIFRKISFILKKAKKLTMNTRKAKMY